MKSKLHTGFLAGAAMVLMLPIQAEAQSRQQSQSLFDLLFADDESDQPRAARPATAPRAKQAPRVGAAAAGKQGRVARGPAVMDGGGRPAISPSAPPVVSYSGGHSPGSVVIDTSGRSLYYVMSGGRAYRYPIAVGRIGFTWTGTQRVSRVASWPDWRPPSEMRQRQPGLPELMTGGVRNPLGAKAIYLGNTLYRIHGTNDVRSIGTASSSGCFRMANSHVTHLSTLVGVGTAVHVMRALPASARRNIAAPASQTTPGRS